MINNPTYIYDPYDLLPRNRHAGYRIAMAGFLLSVRLIYVLAGEQWRVGLPLLLASGLRSHQPW